MESDHCIEAVAMFSRLLGDETTVKLFEALQDVPGIMGIIFQGPHSHARELVVGNQKIELSVSIDTLHIEIIDECVAEDIEKVCGEVIPFSHQVQVRKFRRPTMSDRARRSIKDVGLLGRDDED
ncbi:MAG: methyl-coenzyme M reductase operon protein D [Halobacteriota archaeon]|nr:methyl-coenzyme M reductase operon protein D [Halobacteriota archaeon]